VEKVRACGKEMTALACSGALKGAKFALTGPRSVVYMKVAIALELGLG
jgi:hypothetical protein